MTFLPITLADVGAVGDRDALELVAVARRSSPPSPVLLLPPMRFIASASVVCASVEIEPATSRRWRSA